MAYSLTITLLDITRDQYIYISNSNHIEVAIIE